MKNKRLYIILALIIEKATGLNYRQAMQELIFKPFWKHSCILIKRQIFNKKICEFNF